jgi:hypothetical protein
MSMVTPGVQAALDQIAAAALAEQIRSQSLWIRVLCAIVTGILAVTGALVGVIYFGMNEHLKSLDDKFQTTYRSGIKVEELLTKSPLLEQKINETHDTVIRLQDGQAQILKLQDSQSQIMKEQLAVMQSIQMDQQKMRTQLDDIQKQVHAPK